MKQRFFNGRTRDGEPLELFVENGVFVAPGACSANHDLEGRTVVPGFVDAHCHIIPMGLDLQKLNLSPCSTKDEVLDLLRSWVAAHPGPWFQAVQYDQTRFADCQHLTRHDLDHVVPDWPVILRHSNGHASVANSKALELAGIDEAVSDPAGGTFVRDESGHLTGVLLERAHEFVTSKAPAPTLDDMTDAVLRAAQQMSKLGITCATDMMTGRWNLELELQAYRRASERGCPIRLRMFAQWATVLGPKKMDPGKRADILAQMDTDRCRLNGLKIFADGAIGSATAAISGQYLTTGGDGQLIYSPERFKEMFRSADAEGWQVAVHSIGDRSTDLVMDAMSAVPDPSRHRIEHAMLLSDDQIERLSSLNPFVTMQPEFLKCFGHAYQKQLGGARAWSIKRFRSVKEAGLRLSFSSDRPIVPGDPWDGIESAVQRPVGFDPSESVTLSEAMDLYTVESARVNGDHGRLGSLDLGCLADFQTYDRLDRDGLRQVYFNGVLV